MESCYDALSTLVWRHKTMTLDEIRRFDREFLTPAQVAPLLGCDAQDVRVCARECPERLGFNVALIGTRVKIPRLAFIEFMCGKK